MRSPVIRFIETHPFLRVLFPLMAGIAVADVGDGCSGIPYLYLVWALIVTMALLCMAITIKAWRRSVCFGALSFSFFFLLGLTLCTRQWRQVAVGWPQEAKVYEGVLLDGVVEKKRSYLCPVHLTAQWNGDTCRTMDADIQLYLPKESTVSTLRPGYTVRFYGQISPPQSFSADFDYARYLRHHRVTGTLYTKYWQLADTVSYGWKTEALQVRDRLLDYIRQSGVTGDEGAVFSALTLGYKEGLDDEVLQQYSVSGASHVLALSGLHVGVLCMVFSSIMGLFLLGRGGRRVSQLLVVLLVWVFVFVAGLPVSAVRAAVMFSLFVLASCFRQEGVPLNTLALTAFGMLVYNPFYLFDVGFQMSFMAVAALLLLLPWVRELLPRSRHAVVRYVWGVTAVSFVAQIGVAPLVLHYFSRISPYALLVNLWVVPLTYIIVCLAIPFLLLSLLPLSALQMAMGWCVTQVVTWMNAGVSWCNRLPGADVSGLSFSLVDVACSYVALGLFFYGLMHRNRRVIVWIMVCACVAVMWRLCISVF